MEKEKDYKEVYNDFWKTIVEKDGQLDKDQVMRELSDFSFMLEQVPLVYMEVTRGRISKTNTYAFEVINQFNELFLDKGTTEDDILDILERPGSYKSRLQEVLDYLEIDHPLAKARGKSVL